MPFRNKILLSLRKYSHGYIGSLLKTARKRGELRSDIDLDLDKINFILDAVMDRFLQAQTIKHLDGGLGLYEINEADAIKWITGLIDIIRTGIGKTV